MKARQQESSFPPYLYEAYRATVQRAPHRPLVAIPQTLSEATGPGPAISGISVEDSDLTLNMGTEAPTIGERIIITGHVLDEHGNPVRHTLIEIWQANAAGRYRHRTDQHHAPLDPNFLGFGRVLTDEHGVYRFVTVRPGAYPWENHPNAWRPAHIHFSLFGPSSVSRLITQMYFPGDPLLKLDPIYLSVPDPAARERLVCAFDMEATVPERALGYRFDIVLRGRVATPLERGLDGGAR